MKSLLFAIFLFSITSIAEVDTDCVDRTCRVRIDSIFNVCEEKVPGFANLCEAGTASCERYQEKTCITHCRLNYGDYRYEANLPSCEADDSPEAQIDFGIQ